jgi:hypothetical protein
VQFFIFKISSGPGCDTKNLFGGSLGGDLSLVLKKLKPFASNFNTFFQIQKLSCTHYTLLNINFFMKCKVLQQIKTWVYTRIEFNN